jgi:hypothetical protein
MYVYRTKLFEGVERKSDLRASCGHAGGRQGT